MFSPGALTIGTWIAGIHLWIAIVYNYRRGCGLQNEVAQLPALHSMPCAMTDSK